MTDRMPCDADENIFAPPETIACPHCKGDLHAVPNVPGTLVLIICSGCGCAFQIELEPHALETWTTARGYRKE